MAVAVSRDLKVHMLEDANATKLLDSQQALKSAVQKGEPKCLGVTQLMLGLLVMSYSIPLHFADATEVVRLLVPWWSGLTFLLAGIAAIILDKHCNMKILGFCLLASAVSAVLSVVALVLYFVDISWNHQDQCDNLPCDDHYQQYATNLSHGIKMSLSFFTMGEGVISVVLCCLLFKQRHSFAQYSTLNQAAPSSTLSSDPVN